MEFIQDNPDFAPKAKRTISRIEFYRWLVEFGDYKKEVYDIKEDRDLNGRWIIYLTDKKKIKNVKLPGMDF